jgi:polyphenol oxidase
MAVEQTLVVPQWPAPARVHAFATTRATGDMGHPEGRKALESVLPAEPVWLRQVHGSTIVDADGKPRSPQADGAVARNPGTVCVVRMADCMPVLLTDVEGTVIAAAHAGWRGLAAGVLETAIDVMKTPPGRLLAWLGPAIGPAVYEVGEDVRAAFAGFEGAFRPNRPGHWLLDLYAIASERLARKGVEHVYGGGLCTYSESERFFSFRRDRATERMAALIWIA